MMVGSVRGREEEMERGCSTVGGVERSVERGGNKGVGGGGWGVGRRRRWRGGEEEEREEGRREGGSLYGGRPR